ncbi:putative NADH-quinone oxidoreductase chain N [Halobacteriovorax marinus SJ]|uniref:NADH-quinone oxidoreductase subunit N n=1 Tax=Halobacteriovorax marinus (strain ATCC BAA-682 / DSM 15412 / SJ) TaxID=862908 RepID=E1X1Q3_HALMS|nr:NADH-quinone oxidoreductase subunit N [Halobacteriovorax marinus]CBW24972.1 putative NADH-quinone oxidoreductase chain N [Halobacteriovorax marinus SJ]
MLLNYLASIGRFTPEIILVVTMIGLLFVESTYGDNDKGSKKGFLYATAYAGLLLALVKLVASLGDAPGGIFTNALTIDPFSTLAKIIMVLGTAGSIYLSRRSEDIYGNLKGEFAIISVGVLIGGMLLASANNMLMLYIGIETLSILSYVLASLKKNDDRSSEAGLKYSLYGGISAGIMLFGLSHIFGVLGTIQFTGVIAKLQTLDTMQVAILMPSFLMFFAGIGYKIACVPFHMWAPDVYEGSPLPVTTFFSIVPKIAGIAVLVRVTMTFFGGETSALQMTWVGTLSVIAALTMTVGNVSAIGQRSVKRMLAYSSISHAGMMMMGVVCLSELGVTGVLFYGITYLFMTLVAFFITSFVQDEYGNDHFERFNGLIFKHPLMAIFMIITMFSLAGIPPFSGFVAKFNIFNALIDKNFYVLAIIAGMNSVVALYYYMKIVRLMVFKPNESEEKIAGFGFSNQLIIAVFTVPVVLLGVFWENIVMVANGAKIFIQ